MKILVLSDSHSALSFMRSCIETVKPDRIIHLGDYYDDAENEKILLQGVVDCALVEPDGITVLDFKTDRVSEETLPTSVERYRPQVEAYADALCRIFEKEVKEKYLYFFHLDRLVKV